MHKVVLKSVGVEVQHLGIWFALKRLKANIIPTYAPAGSWADLSLAQGMAESIS